MMFSRFIIHQNTSEGRMLPAREWLKSISISTHLTLGMLLRLILIAYGQHQDETMEVLYTDVDYKADICLVAIFCNDCSPPFLFGTFDKIQTVVTV